MPDYLFTSLFESIFSCKSKDRISFMSQRYKTITAPEDQRADPLAILYMVKTVLCAKVLRKLHVNIPADMTRKPTKTHIYVTRLVLGNRN